MYRRSLSILVACGGSFAGGFVAQTFFDARTLAVAQPGSPLPPPPTPLERGGALFEPVVRKLTPSVVAVDAVRPPAATGAKAGKPTEESGSGVIVRLDGARGLYTITNNHVVGGAKAQDVTVTLADGRIAQPDRVWTDPESDVAILHMTADDLPAAELGDSDRVRVGQWVLAFGSPFGLNQTVTHGIISARDRGQISLGSTIRIKEFLQTDAAINPGSSGGPLVDLDGRVVGINTAIASNNGNNSGVSFSIPANLVKRVARELLAKGTVSRGYFGVQLAPTIEPAAALRMGLPKVWGALVESVHPGGPAAAAGLQPGDVILKLDAVEIRDENHFINLVSALPANQRVRVTVWRNRQPRAIDVTVGDWTTAVGRNR